MPVKAFVLTDVAIAAIETFIDSFRTKDFPKYSDPIWTKISEYLKGKWSPTCVYTNVRENRRDILTKARINQAIILQHALGRNMRPDDMDLGDGEDSDVSVNHSDDEDGSMADNKADNFDLIITKTDWAEIKSEITDTQGKLVKKILKKNIWTNLIATLFWLQYRMPCAFMFKNYYIRSSSEASKFLTIKGYCSSDSCGNKFYGSVTNDLGDDAFTMIVGTRDTRGFPHAEVHRHFNGE